MAFSEDEIEKCKELKKLGLQKNWSPKAGQYVHARECPDACSEISAGVFLIQSPTAISPTEILWLPTFDDLLTETKRLKITFSQVTDYLHRRRFADKNEREGVYQLLIEQLRSTTK